jgi:hypothetical protein
MRFLTRYFRALALFIAALALVGCAQVPRASMTEEAKAKQFVPQAETASLYIFRDEVIGSAITMPVNLNNQNIGHTGPKSFFYLNVAPGRYTIESVAETTTSFSIDVEAAKNYFVWQEMKMGLMSARSQLSLTDEARGRQGVQGSKMIAVKPGTAFAPADGVRTAVAPAPVPVAMPVPAPAATVTMPFVPDFKPVGRAAPPAPAAAPATATVAVVSPAQPALAATAQAAAPTPASKKESRLQWLKQMRDANLITAGEYETKRQQVLSAP